MNFGFYKMKKNLSAERIAFLAFAIWLMSLLPFYPALIFYNGDKLSGIHLLITGWLGPIYYLQVAWYANIFFIIGVLIQLYGKKPAVKTSILAVILASDSFRYKKILLDEGGGTGTIFGYGFGYIFWISAIFILFVSVGFAVLKSIDKIHPNCKIRKVKFYVTLFPLSFFFLFLWGSSLNLFINGNNYEQELRRSSSVILKRQRVCGKEVLLTKSKFEINRDSPLEIVNSGNVWLFKNLQIILGWGIPKIRINNYDYTHFFSNDKYTLVANKKYGKAGALLKVYKTHNRFTDKKNINIQLSSTDGKRIAFEQEWVSEIGDANYMCPEYSSLPNENEQPRKVIIDSLIFNNPITKNREKYNCKKVPGVLISEFSENISVNRTSKKNNYNCPDNIGYLSANEKSKLYKTNPLMLGLGRPYKINNKLYFLKKHITHSVCTNNFTYLYKIGRSGRNDEDLHIMISKRPLNTFHEKWSISVKVNNLGNKIIDKNPIILIAEEKKNLIFFDLFDGETGIIYRIKSKFKDR